MYKPTVLRDYQVDAVSAIERALNSGLVNSALLTLPTGTGKAQPLSSLVLTPSGFAAMGSLAVGDQVTGSDGTPTHVVGVFPKGIKRVLKFTFSDGTEARCCEEHLWAVQQNWHKHEGYGYKIKTAAELISDVKRKDGSNKWFIPVVEPVRFESSHMSVDPYLIGALLGDGCLRSSIAISSADRHVVQEVSSRLPPGHSLHHKQKYDYHIKSGCLGQTGGELRRNLGRLGMWGKLSHQKAIPEEYKTASLQDRIMLLRGLMDTDGYLTSNGIGDFSSTSKQLAEDVVDLVRSLGGVTKLRRKAPGRYTHKGEKRVGRVSYRVTVSTPMNPFSLPRKAAKYKLNPKQGRTKAIESITYDGYDLCQCIKVKAEDGLYVTDGYTITHNTTIFTELAKRNTNSRTLIVCPMRELIHQAADKVQHVTGVFPDIEMASFRSNEVGHRCKYIVASKQTLTMKQRDGSKRYQRLTDIGLLILDEAHTVITGPTIEMIDWYRDRGAMIVGVTATPNRHDKKSLKNAFDVCPYSMTLPEAINAGWLVSPRSNVVRVKSMDLSHVKVQGGDFSATGLNAVVEEERVELEMADVIARESVGLKTAVYCSSVAQAEKLSEILSVRYGLMAGFVCADEKKCPPEQRLEVLHSFKSDVPGAIQIVTNCGVLTTGWDFPGLEHIVMARPTKSLSLYTQILGRATRPLSGTVDFPGSTPELRRAAIADSRKPHFKMTDLVDISLSHRICTTIDALEGEIDETLRDRFLDEVIDGGVVDVQQKMEELRRRMEDEERAEKIRESERIKRQQMLLEARRRQGIRANVEYDTVAVDVMDAPGIRQKSLPKIRTGPVALFGKYKGQPLSDINSGYLKWKLENLSKIPQWYRTQIQNELIARGG